MRKAFDSENISFSAQSCLLLPHVMLPLSTVLMLLHDSIDLEKASSQYRHLCFIALYSYVSDKKPECELHTCISLQSSQSYHEGEQRFPPWT